MRSKSPSSCAAEAVHAPVEGLAPDIDPVRFAKRHDMLEGRTPASMMPRLCASGLLDDGALVEWCVQGEVGRDELDRVRQFLVLSLRFSPVLSCGRCLGPVSGGRIESCRRFRLAATERQADLEDPEAGGDVDVIATVAKLPLAELIEDEAILALPMAVRHDVCPDPSNLNRMVSSGA